MIAQIPSLTAIPVGANPKMVSYMSMTEFVLIDASLNWYIIAADGMCEAGRITHHLAAGIEDPKNTILIVGFMAENTLGRKILEGEKEVQIFNSLFSVKANVDKINAFSAHADYKEEIDWLNSIDTSRLKKIFLVHGEPESQAFLKKELIKAGYKNVEIVKSDTKYIL